ncbi:MAG: PLP-dependent aminotransferase family protein [Acetobacteraceae bacterium]
MADPPHRLGPDGLDRAAGTPLQAQLYRRIRTAIADGRLPRGERLPSARGLAAQLGIARGTVDAAYARLAGEGYLLARGPAGTIVSPTLQLSPAPHPRFTPHPRPDRPGNLQAPAVLAGEPDPASDPSANPAGPPLPFRMGLPALDMFPRALWARLTARAARRLGGAGLAYPDPAGLPALREAITAYLAVSRGLACRPSQVIVTGGYQAAISLVARLLLRTGDLVWFEDPGYGMARQALEAASATIVPVPVDDDGLCVAVARARWPRARLAVVTPAHQSPLGVALSLVRRQALLAWATATGAWIVEDDYDSEFHYVGTKLPALKSLDDADRVIYAGSFSKTLFPGLRLGYLVVPWGLVGPVTAAVRVLNHGEAGLAQAVVADFMIAGHFARHLKRMRGVYAARRTALADALAEAFGARLRLALRPGGLHLLARFPDGGPGGADDTAMMRRALAHGLAPTALSSQFLGGSGAQGLLLGFTNIPEAQAAAMADALRRALG